MKTIKLLALTVALLCSGCREEKPNPIYQEIQAEVIAVYQVTGGAYETCLKLENDTRFCCPNKKLGQPGDKFPVWHDGGSGLCLQDPTK